MNKNKQQKPEGLKQMPHTAYNPHQAFSECNLFQWFLHYLRSRRFNNLKEVEVSVKGFFELVSAWDQITSWKIASDNATL